MSKPFHASIVDYISQAAVLHQLRQAVFVQEQGIPAALEQDDADAGSIHALALDACGQPIATGRLSPDHRIGRMAVLPPWRGQGVGEAILDVLSARARTLGWDALSLHAQVPAIGFYARLCWLPQGPRHVEAGIEHQTMQRRLDGPIAMTGLDAHAAALASLAHRARRHLAWRCPPAWLPLVRQDIVQQALRQHATRGGERGLRVLLDQGMVAHPALASLRQLTQRLPSIVQVRELSAPDADTQDTGWMFDDRGGYGRGDQPGFGAGRFDPDGHAVARRLSDEFNLLWERAEPCQELRTLAL